MAGEGRTDRPVDLNYKASGHRPRSSMRNDSQGRRIEIGGKDFERRRGTGTNGQDDDPGCVGKEHRQDIIHLQGIILLLAGSRRRRARARARPRARCVFFFSLSLYLPSTLPPLFSGRKNRGAESPLPLLSVGRGREKDPARNLRVNKGAAIGAAAPWNGGGMRFRAFPPPFI